LYDLTAFEKEELGMKRKLKNIAIVSLALLTGTVGVGLAATSLTSCSTNSKSLYIDSLPLKTSYKVGEAFSLEGLAVYGKESLGSYLDNSKSELIEDYSTSIEEGTILENEGEFTVTITKNGYNSTFFKITVGDVTVSKLYLKALPRKLAYNVGEKFKTNGLAVCIADFKNGTLVRGTDKTLGADEYNISTKNGEVLNKEGDFVIEISKSGYESEYFTIAVSTEDSSLYDLIKLIQDTNNYTMEIYNTVATTVDTNGFHYKEFITDDYFEKITYKKTEAEEDEEYRGLNPDTDIAYVNYEKGVYQVDLMNTDENGDPTPGKVLSDQTKWKKADLVYTMDEFSLDDVPTTTRNGKYIYEVKLDRSEVDANAGQTSTTWTNSLANNPFAASFLSVCGWSESLIEILTTIDISITTTSSSQTLLLKGNLGGYGYTTVSVSRRTSQATLDTYMQKSDRSFDTNVDDIVKEPYLLDLFTNGPKSYTRVIYASNQSTGESYNAFYIYYGENFLWFQPTTAFRAYYDNLYEQNYGYGISLPASGYINVTTPSSELESYTGHSTGVFKITGSVSKDGEEDYIDSLSLSTSSLSYYASSDTFKDATYEDSNGAIDTNFLFPKIKGLLDTSLETNYANTFFEYTRLSSDTTPFIVSYDINAMKLFYDAFIGDNSFESTRKSVGFNTCTILPTYNVDDNNNKTGITSLDIYLLNMNTYSGYAVYYTEINDTTLPNYANSVLGKFLA